MSTETDWSHLFPAPVRSLPADLVAIIAVVSLTNLAVLAPVLRDTPVRVALGLPFVLFVPGYAFIAALFPEGGTPPSEVERDGRLTTALHRDRGIDGIERVTLSFGLSIAIVPLLGLALNFTPLGVRLVPVLGSVSAFTLLATVVAAHRRRDLPEDERFRVPYRAWIATGRSELFEPDTRGDAVLNVVLVLSVLLAVGSVGYAVAAPNEGESFTEFYLVTENETGDLVAEEHPTEFTRGESEEIVAGVVNREHEPEEYQVAVELHRVELANNSTRILEREAVSQHATGQLGHNETWLRTTNVSPTMTGERLRLTYMLYRDGVPDRPTPENAYRELHLWVNVTESENETTANSDDAVREPGRSTVRGGSAGQDATQSRLPRVRVQVARVGRGTATRPL
ncbi:DUF1616 domain-containing protein [Halostella sp. PRR32]|uniref:DUF1616 domain-containing protein n=1 Tax=Halostella sp. PRR32 TaxID=3098147 RepID=UPI002B1DBAAC|nr:DUF1616 domain-containing protein [Halostella sp. PRR32]